MIKDYNNKTLNSINKLFFFEKSFQYSNIKL